MSSSLVSFAKREIFETLPGLQIATYRIQPSKEGNPEILHVNNSFYYKPDIEGNQDRIAVSSAQIAESIVHMHNTSQLAARPDAHPAFFFIPDIAIDADGLIKNYLNECKKAQLAQRTWFTSLVRIADDDWVIAQRHNMISDIQRTAARELGLQRPWLLDIQEETGLPSCPFCAKNLLAPNAPVCPNCNRVVNPERLKEIEAGLLKKASPTVNKTEEVKK